MKYKIDNFSSGINGKLDEEIFQFAFASLGYNYSKNDATIKPVCGFKPFISPFLTVDTSLDRLINLANGVCSGRVFIYTKYNFTTNLRDDKLIVVDENKDVFYLSLCDNNPTLTALNLSFSSFPTMINYRLDGEDVVIFASPTDSMVVWDGVNSPEIIIDAPNITSMVIHGERLFATTSNDETELWFSDDLNPTNWSVSLNEAGVVAMVDDLRGKLKKVISFNDYLYIFREFGISRLTATGSQTSFFLAHLFTSSGKIYENTVSLAGDKIVFVASDGIYYFNGFNATKVLDNLFPLLNLNENSKGVYNDGKYYLTCNINFGDNVYNDSTFTNNAVVVIDVNEQSFDIIRGVDAVDMFSATSHYLNTILLLTPTGEHPLLSLTNNFGNSLNNQLSYKSGTFVPDKSKRKYVLKKLFFSSVGDFTITLFNELNQSKTIQVANNSKEFSLRFPFSKLHFHISSSDPSFQLKNLEFVYS